MSKPAKKRKQKEPRSMIVLGMILTRKGGRMKARRDRRLSGRNEARELREQARDDAR